MFHHFPLHTLCDVNTNLEAWAEAKPLKMVLDSFTFNMEGTILVSAF